MSSIISERKNSSTQQVPGKVMLTPKEILKGKTFSFPHLPGKEMAFPLPSAGSASSHIATSPPSAG